MVIKKSVGDYIFDIFNYTFLFILSIVFLYPLYYVLMASFSEPLQLLGHNGLLLRPLGFVLDGYRIVLRNPNILSGYINTIYVVVVGTTINMIMTVLGAYVLARKDLYLKKVFMIMIIITMYFSGGMIPSFLLVRGLGMFDTRMALVIPTAIATWNLIIMRTAFMRVPEELAESGKIDGANDFTILWKITLPLVKATLAVMVLFYAVAHWNSFMPAVMFLRSRNLFPLQVIMREILITHAAGGNLVEAGLGADEALAWIDVILPYATIIVATVPILFIYPFCQKYFTKGVMLGSLKG